MNFDFRVALYLFCMHYHSGQWSRGYRILSRLVKRGVCLNDRAVQAITGKGAAARRAVGSEAWDEWEAARGYYRDLVAKFSEKI